MRPSADYRLVGEALLLLGIARVGLWVLPFRTMRYLLQRAALLGRGARERPERVAWAVAAAAARLPSPFRGCLPKALAAHTMLQRHGAPAELVIGVRREGASGRVQAHAWVRSGQQVVTGGLEDLPTYQPLTSPAGPGA
jgi:hypothetical protein